MADDLAAENRRLLARVRRLEEDLAALQERYAYALREVQELKGSWDRVSPRRQSSSPMP